MSTRRRGPPQPRSIRRPTKKKPPRVVIWVFSEGKTEEHYLKALERQFRKVIIKPVSEAGVPKTLVPKAKKKRRELKEEAEREGDSYSDSFEVWAVFDRDEHLHVKNARIEAHDNRVFVAFSNPCVEIWAVLHLAAQSAHISHHDCQRLLKRLMPKYDHDDNPYFDLAQIAGKRQEARTRAVALAKRDAEKDGDHGNPTTSLWMLVDSVVHGGVGAARKQAKLASDGSDSYWVPLLGGD